MTKIRASPCATPLLHGLFLRKKEKIAELERYDTHAARATRIFLAAHAAFCFAKPKNSVSAQEPISHTSKIRGTAQGGASYFGVRVRGRLPHLLRRGRRRLKNALMPERHHFASKNRHSFLPPLSPFLDGRPHIPNRAGSLRFRWGSPY